MSPHVILTMGLANLVADGYSMAIASYNAALVAGNDAFQTGAVTFVAFVVMGVLPIAPFFWGANFKSAFILTALSLFVIGASSYDSSFNSTLSDSNTQWVLGGARTLFLGGSAAFISFCIARVVALSIQPRKKCSC